MKLSNEPNNIFQSKSQNYKYIERSIQILFFPVLLFEMVKREETLLNVMQSVTKNIRSILFTALLAIILVYLFSIVGFVFFQEDFLIEAEDLPSAPSSSCQGKFIYSCRSSVVQVLLRKWTEHLKLTIKNREDSKLLISALQANMSFWKFMNWVAFPVANMVQYHGVIRPYPKKSLL